LLFLASLGHRASNACEVLLEKFTLAYRASEGSEGEEEGEVLFAYRYKI
jgi:hypothetical protein